jgi:hypothetical protein
MMHYKSGMYMHWRQSKGRFMSRSHFRLDGVSNDSNFILQGTLAHG